MELLKIIKRNLLFPMLISDMLFNVRMKAKYKQFSLSNKSESFEAIYICSASCTHSSNSSSDFNLTEKRKCVSK